MVQDNFIKIISNNGAAFTSFRFYNELLYEVAEYYRSPNYRAVPPTFVIGKNLVIDPPILPLLITLGAYLKQYHKQTLSLVLENDLNNNNIINFLLRSDFLYIVGDNTNPTFPLGKNIFHFDKTQIGGFVNKQEYRTDHKVRIYSTTDTGVINVNNIIGEESKRDFLIEHFSFTVENHFKDLLRDSITSIELNNKITDSLSELITNGLYHSGSDAYVMMFRNRYKTTCSISDNGIGLYQTIALKTVSEYYVPLNLFNLLKEKITLNMSQEIKDCAFAIFETFFYSMLKDRQGLFDLILNIVIDCKGYFRLHYDYVQLIISGRMLPELNELSQIRNKIRHVHNRMSFDQIDKKEHVLTMIKLSSEAKNAVISLAQSIFQKYSHDVQYSAIRIYKVKFRGVHIETEIPQEVNQ